MKIPLEKFEEIVLDLSPPQDRPDGLGFKGHNLNASVELSF